jgi:hypothetical protein
MNQHFSRSSGSPRVGDAIGLVDGRKAINS